MCKSPPPKTLQQVEQAAKLEAQNKQKAAEMLKRIQLMFPGRAYTETNPR